MDPARAEARRSRLWDGEYGMNNLKGFLWGPQVEIDDVHHGHDHSINTDFFLRLVRVCIIGLWDIPALVILALYFSITAFATWFGVHYSQPAMGTLSGIVNGYLGSYSSGSDTQTSFWNEVNNWNNASYPPCKVTNCTLAVLLVTAFNERVKEVIQQNMFGGSPGGAWINICYNNTPIFVNNVTTYINCTIQPPVINVEGLGPNYPVWDVPTGTTIGSTTLYGFGMPNPAFTPYKPPPAWLGWTGFGVFGTWAGLTLVSLIIGICAAVMMQTLTARMRLVVTRRLHRALFTGQALYNTIVLSKDVDNYDQRLTDDLQNTLNLGFVPLCSICTSTITALLNLQQVYNATATENESGRFIFTAIVLGGTAFIFFAIPINTIARLLFAQKKLEGDYRWLHCRLMASCESVAIYGGEGRDEAMADIAFDRLSRNYLRMTFWSALLVAGISAFYTKGALFTATYFILYIGNYYHRSTQLFTLLQNLTLGFNAVLTLPLSYMTLAASGGSVHRVGELLEELEKNHGHDWQEEGGVHLTGGRTFQGGGSQEVSISMQTLDVREVRAEASRSEAARPMLQSPDIENPQAAAFRKNDIIVIKKLTASVPGAPQLKLYEDLDLIVRPGDSTAIVGPSGCGKSSLLRVLAGLWPISRGEVEVPSVKDGGIAFLPQRPYVTNGSLLEQIIYPAWELEDESRRDIIAQLLEECGLGVPLDEWTLDNPADWRSILGPGELQKLAFARLFYHKPRFALLDEATSAMDMYWEAKLMQMCTDYDITPISVCHRPTAIALHRFVLRYSAEHVGEAGDPKSWVLEPSPDYGKLTDLLKEEGREPHISSAESFTSSQHELEAPELLRDNDGSIILFFRRFLRLIRLAMPHGRAPAAAAIMVCGLTSTVIAVGLVVGAELSGVFIDGLTNYDKSDRPDGVFIALVFFFIQPFILSVMYFLCAWFSQALAMSVRRCATSEGHLFYFMPRVPYLMNMQPFEIQRGSRAWQPDQRLQQDAAQMTDTLASNIFGGAANPGLMGHFFVITLALFYASFKLSWLIVLATVVMLFLQSFVLSWFWPPVASGTAATLRAEGEFRVAHARIREFAESIAFYGGEDAEQTRVEKLLEKDLIRSYYQLVLLQIPLEIMTGIMSTTMGALPTLASAYIVIMLSPSFPGQGEITAKRYGSVVSFFGPIAAIIGSCVSCLNAVGGLSGRVNRVVGFLEAAEKGAEVAERLKNLAKRDSQTSATNKVAAEGLSISTPQIMTPDGRLAKPKKLLTGLSFSIEHGGGLVIQGGTGSGKSSIVRVFSGLWKPVEGLTWRPPTLSTETTKGDFAFFLPQVPYTTEGNLREQIQYPLDVMDPSEDPEQVDIKIRKVLQDVGLGYLAGRWGLKQPSAWSTHLSGGEMQRLGFARLLYHSPTFAFLDEATSALDVTLEQKCMKAARDAGASLISVSHRDTTKSMHTQCLRLYGDGKGGWELNQL